MPIPKGVELIDQYRMFIEIGHPYLRNLAHYIGLQPNKSEEELAERLKSTHGSKITFGS